MTSFKVKVCGITRPEDAGTACSLGADLIGVIFAKESPRCIGQERARAIFAAIPDDRGRVGVFVNEDVDAILDVVAACGLDMVQLHGDESEIEIKLIKKNEVKVIKGFNITSVADYDRPLKSAADYVLFDNRDKDRRGGTGKPFDWSLTPPQPIPNLVLAGGLSAENLASGVAKFKPQIVDVSSGVEVAPGIKSPEKLKTFFEECDRIRYGK